MVNANDAELLATAKLVAESLRIDSRMDYSLLAHSVKKPAEVLYR